MGLAQKTDTEILAVAHPVMDNLLEASPATDHERHVRDFTKRAKGVLSREAFESICRLCQSAKRFFGKREFAAAFKRPKSIAIVWRQRFTKSPGEFVAELVLVQKNDKYQVDHVLVF
ncbi:MAG: hypothetical protein ACREPU_01930 [Rhodanobacteraceae bacterium]